MRNQNKKYLCAIIIVFPITRIIYDFLKHSYYLDTIDINQQPYISKMNETNFDKYKTTVIDESITSEMVEVEQIRRAKHIRWR